ncbi:MAG: hypothetical protein PHD01_07185 [Geobacteraceae bacterium]|nr:hypothetical protein [Geobacteraceae bacterium]
MKKSFAKKSSVLLAILSVFCLSGIAHAGDTLGAQEGFTFEKVLITAGNYDVEQSTSTKSGDGAACSSNDDCSSKVCEGGSCCTDYGATCDSSSHCCGHQSCGGDGTCPN